MPAAASKEKDGKEGAGPGAAAGVAGADAATAAAAAAAAGAAVCTSVVCDREQGESRGMAWSEPIRNLRRGIKAAGPACYGAMGLCSR